MGIFEAPYILALFTSKKTNLWGFSNKKFSRTGNTVNRTLTLLAEAGNSNVKQMPELGYICRFNVIGLWITYMFQQKLNRRSSFVCNAITKRRKHLLNFRGKFWVQNDLPWRTHWTPWTHVSKSSSLSLIQAKTSAETCLKLILISSRSLGFKPHRISKRFLSFVTCLTHKKTWYM